MVGTKGPWSKQQYRAAELAKCQIQWVSGHIEDVGLDPENKEMCSKIVRRRIR